MGPLERLTAAFNDLAYGRHRGTLTLQARIVDRADMPQILRSPATRPMTMTMMIRRPTTQQREALAQQLQEHRAWSEQRSSALQPYLDGTAPALVTVDIELPFDFEMVSPGTATAEAVIDPELRQSVVDSIAVSSVRLIFNSLRVELKCGMSPIDLSFETFVRVDDVEWPAGTLMCRARNSRTTQWPSRTTPRGSAPEDFSGLWDRGRVDVILRPSAEAAERSPDIVRYWGEEVVFRGVPLQK